MSLKEEMSELNDEIIKLKGTQKVVSYDLINSRV